MIVAYKSLIFVCLVSLIVMPGCVLQREPQVSVQQASVSSVAKGGISGSLEKKIIKKNGKIRTKNKSSSDLTLLNVLGDASLALCYAAGVIGVGLWMVSRIFP